jgi:hypothetical protein
MLLPALATGAGLIVLKIQAKRELKKKSKSVPNIKSESYRKPSK